MALAAAWFETEPPDADEGREDWTAEGAALRWLETLGDPEMHLPAVERCFERSNVTFYVPVNDKAGPAAAMLQSCPAITRSKQPRSFPRIWVGNGLCLLRWPDADVAEMHRAALDRLCRKVTRLGHSSSLVRMWVDDHDATECKARLVTDDLQAEHRARSFSRGTLDMLRERFGEEGRRHHADLTRRIEDLKARSKTVTGQGRKELRAGIEAQILTLETELRDTVSRPPVRPTVGLWTGYRRDDRGRASHKVPHSLFDPDILVLSQVSGPTLPLVSTLAVMKELRKKIMSQGPVPDWVSGHVENGQPLRNNDGHLALVPLPFVGHEHADGHLLGGALVFPRSVPYKERGQVLGPLLVDDARQPNTVPLKLDQLGVWEVQKRDWQELRNTLEPVKWTAFPKGHKTWASVTPVVLDRFPKTDRLNPAQRQAWEGEVHQIVRDACARIRLPEPELIDIDTTSWHLGSPRAVGKRRPLRGQGGSEIHADTALGDGFPPYPPKGTNASRPQVHVWLRFAQPVLGPVILGTGRYQGYGLCKPWGGSRP